MRVSIISFTRQGTALSLRIRSCLNRQEIKDVRLYAKFRNEEKTDIKENKSAAGELPEALDKETDDRDIIWLSEQQSVTRWAGEQFQEKNALIFIGAAGIAVRAIAPFVRDKLSDSPVIAADEKGQFVIPLLSGHVGGANELAERIAAGIGAAAVITTATDVNHKFAVDVWAKQNLLTIPGEKKDGIKQISAKILRNERITISVEKTEDGADRLLEKLPAYLEEILYPPDREIDLIISGDSNLADKAKLFLKPKEYVLGIGCRKGKSAEELDTMIRQKLEYLGISISDIARLASIDRKKEEKGILEWTERYGIPFVTYTETELRKAEGSFHGSAFVEHTVGVDNVCERAALLACEGKGQLILEKQAEHGITVAAAKRKWSVRFDET